MITLPKPVRGVLETLEAAGHAAYLVGGPVRDLCLGKTPQDWDIATAALPETVQSLFPKTIPTGLVHGTVTVLTEGLPIEVTTFRRDGAYQNHRRPEQVNFVTDLHADLSRRDFTINAMALDLPGQLIDPFGGQADLYAKRIRCVGNPTTRFDEDALRMFRTFRFSAQLDFQIDPITLAAIRSQSHLANSLSAERVRDELEKILLSPRPETLADVLDYGLLTSYIIPTPAARAHLAHLDQLSSQTHLCWAAFGAILLKSGAIDNPEDFLRSLRLDTKTVHIAGQAALLSLDLPCHPVTLKQLLARQGKETLTLAAQVAALFGSPRPDETLEAIFTSGDCYCLPMLALTGADLMAAGYPPGPALGELLGQLLSHVFQHPSENEQDTLLRLARQFHDLNPPLL